MSDDHDLRETIRLRGVAREFLAGAGSCTAGVVALADASMEIRSREVLLVCGPAGAGKTTLLLCAAGLLHFDAGEVERGIRRVIYRDLARGGTADMWPRRAAILLDSCDDVGALARPRVARSVAAGLSLGSAIVLAGREPASCLALVPDTATISIIHLRRGTVIAGRPAGGITHRVAEASGGGGY